MDRKGYAVLIVEDDLDDVLLLTRALHSASKSRGETVTVTHHRNGFDALSAVARAELTARLPDIVVVDLNMPVMNGERFLVALRRVLELPGLLAVVLTTATASPIHEAALAAGADRVFVKPNSLGELEEIAREILRTSRAAHAANPTSRSEAA